MNPRQLFLTLALLLLTGLIAPGCASKSPDDPFERDDYFGGHGTLTGSRHYVPKQVQRN